jgi:hypothetical protein
MQFNTPVVHSDVERIRLGTPPEQQGVRLDVEPTTLETPWETLGVD